MRTLIRDGTIVNAHGRRPADVLVAGERIAAIGEGLRECVDLVIFDPAASTRISAATHHMRVDYNLYEGRTLAGAIETVMARGDVIVERGALVGAPGRGRFLKRAPFTPRALSLEP